MNGRLFASHAPPVVNVFYMYDVCFLFFVERDDGYGRNGVGGGSYGGSYSNNDGGNGVDWWGDGY